MAAAAVTTFQEPFKCVLCSHYQAPVLKSLVNHVYVFHANQVNFKVFCAVEVYNRFHSWYKHVTKKHKVIFKLTENNDNDNIIGKQR